MQIVQAEGSCIGHDYETLKNKVKSLLTWVQMHLAFFIHLFYGRLANNVWQGSTNKKSAWSPMAHEAEKDLAFFASILGKLDMIEHLQCDAQDVKEAHKVELKEVSLCVFLYSILTVK